MTMAAKKFKLALPSLDDIDKFRDEIPQVTPTFTKTYKGNIVSQGDGDNSSSSRDQRQVISSSDASDIVKNNNADKVSEQCKKDSVRKITKYDNDNVPKKTSSNQLQSTAFPPSNVKIINSKVSSEFDKFKPPPPPPETESNSKPVVERKDKTTNELKGGGNAVIVNSRQRGNPILKHIRNVPWEFGNIIPDYVMGPSSCALFLSLRYHNLNPAYIHSRLDQLAKSYNLRVLLVLIDIADPHHALKELSKLSIVKDLTMILAWSNEEAGRYIETYKTYQYKPPEALKGKQETDFYSQAQDCLTSVRSVNKTDVSVLFSRYRTMDRIASAATVDLETLPGFGPQKARRLYHAFHEPFIKQTRKKSTPNPKQLKIVDS